MTKGPPGLLGLLPVAAVGWHRRRRGKPRVLWSWPGFALFLAVSLWWYAALVFKDASRAHDFLVNETWNRIFTAAHHRDTTPLVYLAVFVAGSLPWTLGFLPLAARVRQWWTKRPRRAEPAAFLLAWWLIPAVIIFCLARSRMILYVGPLFVPLAICLARVLDGWIPILPRARHLGLVLAWIGLLLLVHHVLPRVAGWGGEARAIAGALRNDAGASAAFLFQGAGKTLPSVAFYADLELPPQRLHREEVLEGKPLGPLPGLSDANQGPVYVLMATADRSRSPLEHNATVVFSGVKWTLLRLRPRLPGRTTGGG